MDRAPIISALGVLLVSVIGAGCGSQDAPTTVDHRDASRDGERGDLEDSAPGERLDVPLTQQLGEKPQTLTLEEKNAIIGPPLTPSAARELRQAMTRDLARVVESERGIPLVEPIPAFRIPGATDGSLSGLVGSGNASGFESGYTMVLRMNRELILDLSKYRPASVKRVFERRMAREKSHEDLQYLYAALAAGAGSAKAARFILGSLQETDYFIARRTHGAIATLMRRFEEACPEWVVEMAMAALGDERYVTGLEKTNYSSDTLFEVGYLADEDGRLAQALGRYKCEAAVPFLISLVERTGGRRGPVMALGRLGDGRAIPVLLKYLERAGQTVDRARGGVLPDAFSRPVDALASLEAVEAVPLLLEYLRFPTVIRALERIGDPRATGPLKALVRAEGRMKGDGKADAKKERERLAAAHIALITLSATDRVAGYCTLLEMPWFTSFQRREVVWRLRQSQDERAVPCLVSVILDDPDGAPVNQTIDALSDFKCQSAVEGLLEGFDVDFTGMDDWKRAHTPEMFRANIGRSLEKLTQKSFGADKDAWRNWWREEGRERFSDGEGLQ
jgi:HEAT repeat protein